MAKREKNGELSTEERDTLAALQSLTEEHGYPPTVDELAEQLGLRVSVAHRCLNRLIEEGFVRKKPNKARSLEILRTPLAQVIGMVSIPLLGVVPAGVPICVEEEHDENIDVQASVVGSARCFALNVVGHSMRDADICDKDILIVRQQPLAEDGDIVVASVDGEVTVKRLSMSEGVVRLLPANDDFQPIEIEPKTDLRVLGKVIATRRMLSRLR